MNRGALRRSCNFVSYQSRQITARRICIAVRFGRQNSESGDECERWGGGVTFRGKTLSNLTLTRSDLQNQRTVSTDLFTRESDMNRQRESEGWGGGDYVGQLLEGSFCASDCWCVCASVSTAIRLVQLHDAFAVRVKKMEFGACCSLESRQLNESNGKWVRERAAVSL